MRLIARHFGIGSVAALAVVVATGVAMASHFSLWHSDILRFKLAVLVLVAGLLAMHVLTPTSRADSYGVAAASLLVVWLGSNSPTERWLQAGTKRVRQLARAGTPVHEI